MKSQRNAYALLVCAVACSTVAPHCRTTRQMAADRKIRADNLQMWWRLRLEAQKPCRKSINHPLENLKVKKWRLKVGSVAIWLKSFSTKTFECLRRILEEANGVVIRKTLETDSQKARRSATRRSLCARRHCIQLDWQFMYLIRCRTSLSSKL